MSAFTFITMWVCPWCFVRNTTPNTDLMGICRNCEQVHEWWDIDTDPLSENILPEEDTDGITVDQ